MIGTSSRITAIAIACSLAASGALAQNAGSQKESGAPAPNVVVEQGVPAPLFDLRVAVRALRQASVMLVNKETTEQAGPARQKAFEAAQDAIYKVQRAMIQLPARYHAGPTREATDWPKVAGRIEAASVAIEKALSDLEKDNRKPDAKALQSLNGALGDAETALRSMPEWRVGAGAKGT